MPPEGNGISDAQRPASQPATPEGGAPPQPPEQQQPKSEQAQGHKLPYTVDLTTGEPLNGIEAKLIRTKTIKDPNAPGGERKIVIDYNQKADGFVQKTKELIPQNDGESESDYNLRILDEVGKRVRFRGDYRDKEDAIYDLTKKEPDAATLLMAIEAKSAHIKQAENEKVLRQALSEGQQLQRRKVRTAVRHDAIVAELAGNFDNFFAEKPLGADGKPAGLEAKELPEGDLIAFTFIADRLMDVQNAGLGHNENGQPVTYREVFANFLKDTATNPQSNQRLVELRRDFYRNAVDALKTRELSASGRQPKTDQEKVVQEMRKTLQTLQYEMSQGASTEGLVGGYKGIKPSEKTKQKLTRVLSDYATSDVFDMALKGGDLMYRRSLMDALPLSDVPKIITYKEMVQGPDDGEPERPAAPVVAPVRDGGVIPPTQEGDGNPPPAPTEDDEHRDGGTGGDETVERPSPPGAAPVSTSEQTPPEPPPSELVFGAVAEHDRLVQNELQNMEYSISHDLQRMPALPKGLGGLVRLPFWAVRHPVTAFKMVWQNTLARTLFKSQHLRFVHDMETIVKRTTDQSVPIEVTPDLIDHALTQARDIKSKQSWWRKSVWKVSDFVKGITGISQTSDQILANEWLGGKGGKGGQVDLPADQRDAVLQQIVRGSLAQQTKEGDRYADLHGMAVDKANRFLATDAGETRHEIPEDLLNPSTGVNLRTEANQRIKEIIKRYVDPTEQNRITTDEALVKEVNKYLMGDFLNALPDNLRAEFRAPEIASNIISLARAVGGDNWQRYQEQDTTPGQTGTRFENLQIKMVFGKGEWGGVRGKVESDLITERLARRLVGRELMRGTGKMAGAVALLEDIATFGGAYAAGWGYSAAITAPGSIARAIGGPIGMAVMAGVKETGLDFSDRGLFGKKFLWKGRYQKEIEQQSREASRSRTTPNGAYISQEMNEALVDRVVAKTTAENIEQRLQAAGEQMTEAQAKELLVQLAQLDARMRLTNLSNTRAMQFKTQNYIQFTQGKESEEYFRLNHALMDGIVKLQIYSSAHPGFVPQGQELFSAAGIGHEQQNQQLGFFDKYSALAEGQLRFSTENKDHIQKWLEKNLGLVHADVNDMMQQLLPNIDIHISKDQSLQEKEKIIHKLRARRFGAIAGRTLIGGAAVTGLYEVARAGVLEGVELATEGWGKYSADWQKVLQGEIPITDGQADLTPIQRGALWVEQATGSVLPSGGGETAVDSATLNLQKGVKYDSNADALVNTATGKAVDMRGIELKGDNGQLVAFADRDLNGDGVTNDLDHQQAKQLFESRMKDAGITLDKVEVKDVLTKSGVHADSLLPKTKIPDGTHWVKDGDKFDLVVDSNNKRVLINDASFDANGRLIGGDYDKTLIIYAETGTGGGAVEGQAAVAEFTKYGKKIDGREWYSYNQPGSQGNELRFYDHRDGNAVVLDMSKMGGSYQAGLNPEQVNVQTDVIQKGNAVMAFSIPGHAGEPILAKVPTGELRLDPTDHDASHVVQLYGGKTIQAGDLARMVVNQNALTTFGSASEFGRQDIFNLGLDGRNGFIEAGTVAEQNGRTVFQSFATIQGSGGVKIPGGELTSVFDLTKNITDTVATVSGSSPTVSLLGDIQFIPFPARQNIERSGAPVRGERPPEDSPRPTSGQTTPPPAPTADHPAQSEEERQRREQEQHQNELELQRAQLVGEQRRRAARSQSGQASPEDEQRLAEIQQELQRLDSELQIVTQELQEVGPQALQARFEHIIGNVERNNNRFYVENPPLRVDLTDEQLRQLASPLPFFVNITADAAETNRQVVPWAWELGTEGSNNTRFVNGELSTEQDSGLLAVAAASASNPEQQARLYKALADVVLRVHQANPTLLNNWLLAQGSKSLDIFRLYDSSRVAQGAQQAETLIVFDGTIVAPSETQRMWEDRIGELRTALDNDQLTYAQLRQLEFLSHSVNVPEVIRMMQQGQTPAVQSSTPAGQPAQSEEEIRQRVDEISTRHGELMAKKASEGLSQQEEEEDRRLEEERMQLLRDRNRVFGEELQSIVRPGAQQPPAATATVEAVVAAGNTTRLSDDEIRQLGNDAALFVRNSGGEEPIDLMEYRRKISPEVGKRFDAHGIAKGTRSDQVRTLALFLENRLDANRKLYTTNLRLSDEDELAAATGIGSAGPYDTGGFIVIGNPDKPLTDGVAGVLVNEHFYGAIPLLQQRYPNVKFIRADALPQALDVLLSQTSMEATVAGAPAAPEVSTATLKNVDSRFMELRSNGEAGVMTYQTAGKYWWQDVLFGQELQNGNDNYYRGYIMVEPEDMAITLQALTILAQARKAQGKTTNFKWLKMTFPPNLSDNDRAAYVSNADNLGRYSNLNPTDPRIVIYGDDATDIQEILQQLAQTPIYSNVEQNRINKHGGRPENAPRRPGTNAFIDGTGKEWRSLNFNNNPGYSENEAADSNWRATKLGDRTVPQPRV